MVSILQLPAVSHSILASLSQSGFLRRYLGSPYIRVNRWAWRHLPRRLTSLRLARSYGLHLHHMVQLRTRNQSVGTFFFRNRPELELMIRLLEDCNAGSSLDVTVLACSKGAEVYSISYAIRSARPDLKVNLHAVDIAGDVLEFAKKGVYYPQNPNASRATNSSSQLPGLDLARNTSRDQPSSIFERMTLQEMAAMFDHQDGQVIVKTQFREGISWQIGDAADPALVDALGPQDIVVANRFLCHMYPEQAERCLRNLAQLVRPGGYLFISGVDLDVRSKVVRELGWKPVTELISEIHEGDPSLRRDWPMEYWGLEPLDKSRNDWKLRYSSIFRCSKTQ